MGQRIQHINCECFDSIPNGIGIKGLAIHYFFIPSRPDLLNSSNEHIFPKYVVDYNGKLFNLTPKIEIVVLSQLSNLCQ